MFICGPSWIEQAGEIVLCRYISKASSRLNFIICAVVTVYFVAVIIIRAKKCFIF